jgi:hypothetical protein
MIPSLILTLTKASNFIPSTEQNVSIYSNSLQKRAKDNSAQEREKGRAVGHWALLTS